MQLASDALWSELILRIDKSSVQGRRMFGFVRGFTAIYGKPRKRWATIFPSGLAMSRAVRFHLWFPWEDVGRDSGRSDTHAFLKNSSPLVGTEEQFISAHFMQTNDAILCRSNWGAYWISLRSKRRSLKLISIIYPIGRRIRFSPRHRKTNLATHTESS